MSEIIAQQDPETNTPANVKDPQIGWMIGFLLLVSFVGLFALVPLRKVNNLQLVSILSTFVVTESRQYITIKSLAGTDYDRRLQADLSKWHSKCLSYQWFPHARRCKPCKLNYLNVIFGTT